MNDQTDVDSLTHRLKIAFQEVLGRLDPPPAETAAHRDLVGLLEMIRSREHVPDAVEAVAQLLNDRANLAANQTLADKLNDNLAGCNDWLTRKGLPSLGKTEIRAATKLEPNPFGSANAVSERSEPLLPESWSDLVLEIRSRLLIPPSRAPFSHWMLPQLRESSAWCELYEVLPCQFEISGITATILMPPDLACHSQEAHSAWRDRIEAATKLRRHGLLPETVAVVLDCAAPSAPGYVILRCEKVARSLRARISAEDLLSPREALELGLALCDILSLLNGCGVSIHDLNPARIAFKNSPAQRLVQLMDPTAVTAASGVLPEFRSGKHMSDSLSREPSQVFLIGALILGLMRETTDLLRTGDFPSGISASLAALAGKREFADEPAETITIPLITEIDRRARRFGQRLHADRVVETLRWSLAEHRDERFPSLNDLAVNLHRAIA